MKYQSISLESINHCEVIATPQVKLGLELLKALEGNQSNKVLHRGAKL